MGWAGRFRILDTNTWRGWSLQYARGLVRIQAVLLLAAALEAFASEGLTLQRFNNTAFAGPGLTRPGRLCGRHLRQSSSILVTGHIAPTSAGKYGFEVAFSPPLPYPSPEAYARL